MKNWQKYMKMGVVVASVSALMVGCSSNGEEAAPAGDQAASAQGSEAAAHNWDTGLFETTYRVPIDQAAIGPNYGSKLVENSLLGMNTLLPYEIDSELDRSTQGRQINFAGRLSLTMTLNGVDALKPYDDRLQSGYIRTAENEDASREVSVAIMRYDSDKTAQEAVRKLGDALSSPDEFTDPEDISIVSNGFQPLNAPAYSYEKTLSYDNSKYTEVITSYNEYVIYGQADFDKGSTLEEEQQFFKDYLTEQVALLEVMPAHKTEAGFGTNEGYAPADPKGLFRYVVKMPNGDRGAYGEPQERLNARSLAGKWHEVDLMSAALKAAGVEDGFYDAGFVFQARNAEAASSLVPTLVSYDIEDDWTEYDEPQNLPNTRCLEKDGEYNSFLQCYTSYDDFVAYAQVQYATTEEGVDVQSESAESDTADAMTPKNKEEAVKLLSQTMAAQIMIFEDAKVNPEGSKPKSDSASSPSDEATTKESESEESSAASSEPSEGK